VSKALQESAGRDHRGLSQIQQPLVRGAETFLAKRRTLAGDESQRSPSLARPGNQTAGVATFAPWPPNAPLTAGLQTVTPASRAVEQTDGASQLRRLGFSLNSAVQRAARAGRSRIL